MKRSAIKLQGHSEESMEPEKASTSTRDISLTKLKRAIPSRCFKPSLFISVSYLARDLLYLAGLLYCAGHISRIPFRSIRILAWIIYTFAQGLVGTGIWILAHECGHGAFSTYRTLNDCLGWVLHSILLVPYFSWKITHARHHRYNSHIEKDAVFVPCQEHELNNRFGDIKFLTRLRESCEDTPLVSAMLLIGHQLIGWQSYLIFNVTAGKDSKPRHHEQHADGYNGERRIPRSESHFDPMGSLFKESQQHLVAISNIGLTLMLTALWRVYVTGGLNQVLLLYFIPYLWVHHWLVSITYLHHTSPQVAKFSSKAWTYTKGALSTVDRPQALGWIGRHFFHDIADYHVVHHLFPRIPFYWCEEATMAIRGILGDEYVCAVDEPSTTKQVPFDRRKWGFMHALWKTWNVCSFVVEETSSGVEGNGDLPMGTGVFVWQHLRQ